MKTNLFLSAIGRVYGDRSATLADLSQGFADAYGQFARGNDRAHLEGALVALKKDDKGAAIGEATAAGIAAGNLVVGYVGAQSGKFAAQAPEVQSHFDGAVTRALSAFTDSLESSPAFADKLPKTPEEKAKAKADKVDKAAAVDAVIAAKIQAGELVRSIDVKPFPQGEIDSLKLQVATLTAERNALLAENKALLATKATKAKKPATV